MNKPNILWICTDQQRYDTLGCYGNDIVETKNIDKLAKDGAVFEKAYCQSPVCSPSRASFLTGRYPRTCRVRQNGQKIPNDELFISKIFADNGYTTGLVGKLHTAPCHTSFCTSNEERIDDGYHSFKWSHHPDFYAKDSNWPLNEYNMWLTRKGKEYNRVPFEGSPYVHIGPDIEDSHSRFCAENAMEFIKAHEGYKRNPWFLSLNLYDPHHDFDPPENLLRKYIKKLSSKDLPNYKNGELKNKPAFQQRDHLGAMGSPGNFAYDSMSEKDHLLVKAAYYAMIEQIDIQVGEIVKLLEDTNQLENTIIIFTSDHGEMLGDHGIYLKGPYFYEPLVRVPLIFNCKGLIKAAKYENALIELVDIAPTLLELAGFEQSERMQGTSFASKLISDTSKDYHKDSVYSEFYNTMRGKSGTLAYATMVANSNYKLVYYHSTNQGELYDLKNDKSETTNLYNNPSFTDIKISMMELLLNRMAYTIDPLPIRTAQY